MNAAIRGGEKSHDFGLIRWLRLFFDTAAFQGRVTGAVESAPTTRRAGSFDAGEKRAEMGKGGLGGGSIWEKVGG